MSGRWKPPAALCSFTTGGSRSPHRWYGDCDSHTVHIIFILCPMCKHLHLLWLFTRVPSSADVVRWWAPALWWDIKSVIIFFFSAFKVTGQWTVSRAVYVTCGLHGSCVPTCGRWARGAGRAGGQRRLMSTKTGWKTCILDVCAQNKQIA